MLKQKDLYTHVENLAISSSGVQIGKCILEYDVRKYTDVRNLSSKKSYLITCSQRLIIPNPNTYQVKPSTQSGFSNYPALLTSQIKCSSTEASGSFSNTELLNYSPKTLNTAVMSDHSTSNSSGSTLTKEHSSGSSTSQTNSFGGSITIGPFGGISGNYEHAKTKSTNESNTNGHSDNHESQSSSSSSMSIKDWGSYAVVDDNNQFPTWVWGQEYPWDVVLFKDVDKNGNIILPKFVQDRLYDGTIVYPPTQLSLLGINFVSKASWLITPHDGRADLDSVYFIHTLNYGEASHSVSNNAVTASLNALQPITLKSQYMDLDLLALDPITTLGSNNGAVVGFIPDKFTAIPKTGTNFKITSESNNLLITGGGFTAPMITDFSDVPVTMDIYFKVMDDMLEYELFLKCWKTMPQDCVLTFIINDNENNPIVKHVDALDTEGGENNLISIILRNKNHSSADYHDYLALGINKISLTVTPSKDVATTSNCGFAMRALAIC